MNDALDFTPDTALFKKDWLPLEQAIQKVARFEHEFGQAHLALACHAALASILTPELINLIRINFLEPSVEWIAECDLLLSSLCQPINQGVYEIEPQIRQVLLVALQTHPEYGPGSLEEIAHFLYRYSETDFVNELPLHIKRTYQWISGAYIDPDATIQDMFNLLKNVRAEDFMARMPDYLHIGKTLAMIANPLEMSGLQVELDDLVSTAQLSTLYWTGDKENLLSLLPENTSDLDEITHALTKPVVNWLATSEFVTSDEQSFVPSLIPERISITDSPVRTERKPVTIYCSYAYEDEELQRELAKYLAPLQARGLITYWHDHPASLGDIESRKRVFDEYLITAQIILLLISSDFIVSDYHYEFEMRRAMLLHERGDVRVIPIILRPTLWEKTPLRKLQALPINTIPITVWKDRSLAFAEVVSGIERVVEELQTPQSLPAVSMQNKIRATIQSFEIFLAYAYEDTSFLIELENSLAPLREQGLITTWSDRQITHGADRRQAINIHLRQASLIVLLVSPHFLMSDECSYDVQSALQHRTTYGTQVIPIIIRPCMWKEAPFASLNILPTNEKPVSVWEEQSAAFANVVDEIRRAIEDPQKPQLLLDIPLPMEVQAPTQPTEIFFIYAHEDTPFFVELTNYLYPLRQQGSITIWPDSNVLPGHTDETDMYLEQASFILLLVSPNFLASDVLSHQTQRALQRYQAGKARVIPIIVRPCLWEDATFAYLQALPTGSRPITSWSNQDAAFANVANGILRAIEDPEKSQALPEISSSKKMQTTTPPIEIFFMYAREDGAFLVDLKNHLYPLRQQGLITMWSDQDITAGLEWEKEIARHLIRANIILLLVSPDFLASAYCYGIEMRNALERHRNGKARVIPIIVQPCEWRSAPFADLQVLPTNAQPITRWINRDEVFVDVANDIRRVVEDISAVKMASRQDISSSVYVVYGSNIMMRDEIYAFLKDLDLKPIAKEIVINLTGESAPFVGRIIDVAFEHAQAVLILLSGEEQVRLRKELQKQQEAFPEEYFSPQSTLEQIFEAGYAFGKFPERTILLQTNKTPPLSGVASGDIGILTFTKEKKERLELTSRLGSAGCNINNKHSNQIIATVQENRWKESKIDPRRIFVIHGRNEYLKKEVFKFLTMLNLLPISWGEAMNATNASAPYIGEILKILLNEAQAILVLLTGDDEVLESNNLFTKQNTDNKGNMYQPRPNVAFETGISLSNMRLAGRTILVQSGDVKIWEAIHGLHRIKLSNDMKHRWDLALRLQDAGCSVQIPSNELLRQIGNFSFSPNNGSDA